MLLLGFVVPETEHRMAHEAVQNATQGYYVIYNEKKELPPRQHWITFSRE